MLSSVQVTRNICSWLIRIQVISDKEAVGCNTLVYVVRFRQKGKCTKLDSIILTNFSISICIDLSY